MPAAAAAPLISSVQKLVLYETRAVSSSVRAPRGSAALLLGLELPTQCLCFYLAVRWFYTVELGTCL